MTVAGAGKQGQSDASTADINTAFKTVPQCLASTVLVYISASACYGNRNWDENRASIRPSMVQSSRS